MKAYILSTEEEKKSAKRNLRVCLPMSQRYHKEVILEKKTGRRHQLTKLVTCSYDR